MKRKKNWKQNHEHFIKKHFPEPKLTPISYFACGGNCAAGGEHSWDGPEHVEELMSSSTCSKCGMLSIDYCMMHAP